MSVTTTAPGSASTMPSRILRRLATHRSAMSDRFLSAGTMELKSCSRMPASSRASAALEMVPGPLLHNEDGVCYFLVLRRPLVDG